MNKIILTISSLLLLTGCVTVLSRYGSVEKSLVHSEAEFFIKKDRTGKVWGELTGPLLYKTSFTGSVAADNTGDMTFTIENSDFFSNWPNGWTEGKSRAIGKLLFKKTADGYKCQIVDKVEIWDVVEGKIRYFDDYYSGDEGLTLVKNRMDRLTALARFLKKQQLPEYFGDTWRNTDYGEPMKKYIEPLLFPEQVLKKPALYEEILNNKDQSGDSGKLTDNWELGSYILWNKKYTEKLFPREFANLVPIRNTGSMWRDYEEAPGILMMLYNLDYFFSRIQGESFVLKGKDK